MLNARLLQFLRESAPPGLTIVVHPDHPLIYRGPNALLSGPGSLLAVFYRGTSERAESIRPAAHLIGAKLAYPVDTQFILVDESTPRQRPRSDDDQVTHCFDGNFLIGDRGFRDFAPTARSPGKTSALETAQAEATKRFDHASRATRLTLRGNWRETTYPASGSERSVTAGPSLDIRFGDRWIKTRNRYDLDGTPVFVSNAGPQTLRTSLSRFAELQLLSGCRLDNGVPYTTATEATAFVLTKGIEFAVPSNSKLIYATAFADLGIAPDDNIEVLHEFRRRLISFESAQARYRRIIFNPSAE
jgi:hypothetical protein